MNGWYTLSKAEKKVLFTLVNSESGNTREIAESLCVQPQTIKFHLSNIYRKTGYPTRVALAVAYVRATEVQATDSPEYKAA